jgi:short-subunit dehydrogenase
MSTVTLVTGASSGIGEATARRLARDPDTSVVLIARREERLRSLALALGGTDDPGGSGGRVSFLAVDLLDADAPARIRDHVLEHHGHLHLLVNNAGASWRARFADTPSGARGGGYENVQRTMAINFDAVVRLTEALLPLLRASAPSAIVNVASTAGRVARAGTGAYSASKFALAGWSDALWAEERAHGVHVGLVLPGFISTEGYPQSELTARPWTQWIVSSPERAAAAIYEAGIGRRPERYVPRPYALAAVLRVLAPALVRRVLGGSAASVMTTTGAQLAASSPGEERRNGAGG